MVKKILFIHHSTGGNLIREGNLREEIKRRDPSIEFWDHSYNLYKFFPLFLAHFTHHKGLTDNAGHITGKDYNIILSNNSPREYAEIFSKDKNQSPLKEILQYDIIAFKNCYPTTKIISDEQLAEDKRYYTIIRDRIKEYPDKQFILVTPPPLRRELTTSEYAQRAIRLVNWLVTKEFSKDIPNIHIFDLFTLLADSNGFLKKEYTRMLPFDSHPNQKANKTIAPIFAEYLVKV